MSLEDNVALVKGHVASNASKTFGEPKGIMPYKYLLPSGFYKQLWDWDAAFMGSTPTAAAGEYLAGSMKNFFHHTDLSNGEVKGCLTPDGFSPTLRHAKPVVIWAAYLAAKLTGDFEQFRQFHPAMKALLKYWSSGKRFDAETGLHVWSDQMESGADDLPYSEIASNHTPGWTEEEHAYRLSSPDIMTFLVREHKAYTLFLRRWAEKDGGALSPQAQSEIAEHVAKIEALKAAINKHLWYWKDQAAGEGWYCAYDVRTRAQITNKTFLMAWPLWENLQASEAQRDAAIRAILAPDMRCASGIRSTSNTDPRYSNDNIIVPYSNWRGPVWICSNAVLAYTLASQGRRTEALALAADITRILADDLRANGQWHECYHSDDPSVYLASPGFLSWNMMGADLYESIAAGKDPLKLE